MVSISLARSCRRSGAHAYGRLAPDRRRLGTPVVVGAQARPLSARVPPPCRLAHRVGGLRGSNSRLHAGSPDKSGVGAASRGRRRSTPRIVGRSARSARRRASRFTPPGLARRLPGREGRRVARISSAFPPGWPPSRSSARQRRSPARGRRLPLPLPWRDAESTPFTPRFFVPGRIFLYGREAAAALIRDRK